jgi:hypothetical protein
MCILQGSTLRKDAQICNDDRAGHSQMQMANLQAFTTKNPSDFIYGNRAGS